MPPGNRTGGIGSARDDHGQGLQNPGAMLTRHHATEVAIERPDGPVVDTLLGAGIMVLALSPYGVKNLWSRYGSVRSKGDRFDAYVLVGALRTHLSRLRPLTSDDGATVALCRSCRARKDRVNHWIATAMLCAPLRTYCSLLPDRSQTSTRRSS